MCSIVAFFVSEIDKKEEKEGKEDENEEVRKRRIRRRRRIGINVIVIRRK